MCRRLAILAMFAVFVLLAGNSAAAQQEVQITKGPIIENTTSNSAVVAWSTNVNASTVLKYGTDPNNLTQTAQAPWGGLTHRVTLKNLQPDTTYYLQVTSAQGQGTGTGAMSNVTQLRTKPGSASSNQPGPNAPQSAASQSQSVNPADFLIVAGPIPQQITDTSATLWWESNQPSNTVMRYGTDPNNMNQTAQPITQGSDLGHKVQLNGLQPSTMYYVQIVGADGTQKAAGNFRTEDTNYAQRNQVRITNGPVIEYLADNQAIIAWTTSAQSSSVVRYGTDPNNLNQKAEAPWGGPTHRVKLQNLQAGTKYWFDIQSTQAQGTGTMAQSQRFPFQTVNPGQAALKIALQ